MYVIICRCPICLLEYGESEVLRELPYCGHVFHIDCVDSWFEKQNTCPVCRIVLTEAPKSPQDFLSRRSSYCRRMPEPTSVTVEMQQAGVVPAWVLVNRPLPLPPAIPENSSLEDISDIEMNHSGSLSNVNGEAPLLRTLRQGDMGGWGAVYLQRGPGGLSFRLQNQAEITGPVVNRDCNSNHSVSERWTAESFSFGISGGSDDFSSLGIAGSLDSPDTGGQNSGSRASSRGHNHGVWRSDSSKSIQNHNRDSRTSWSSMSTNSSSDFSNHSPMRHWQMDFGLAAEEVFESPVPSPHHLPLTVSPEHCSFEFLPIITGPGGDYSFRPPKAAAVDRPKVSHSRRTYAQL